MNVISDNVIVHALQIKQHVKAAEDVEAIKRENEELKEVLTDVQLDLEAKTEV